MYRADPHSAGTTQAEAAHDGRVRESRRCGTAAVLRVSIDHDGRPCGCDGMCLTAAEEAGPPSAAAWTEVLLRCAEHTAISCAVCGGQFPASATIEDVTGPAGTGSREARS